MSKTRISLIVDHPLRDLPGVSLVAATLAEMNFEVYLVPMYVQERECLALAPQFVLLNYLRKNNETFARRLMKSKIQFGINDTEGGFFGDLGFYGGLLSKDPELYRFMNCNLVWGSKIKNYLQNEFPIRHHTVLTGLPRFDFYSEKYRNIKIDLVPERFRKNLILINTKVAVVNPQFQSVAKEIDLYRNKLGISEELVNHYIKYGRLSIEDNIKLCKDLAASQKSSSIVLRPHPHEKAQTYSRQLSAAEFPNVSVVRDGPVTPWILASKAVIHRHCTTAIEAALCGKPAISPSWMHTSANAPDAENVSHHVNNSSELSEKLGAALAGQLVPTAEIESNLQRLIDEWLYKVDGNAHLRVANAITETLKSDFKPDKIEARKQMFRIYDHRTDLAGSIFNRVNLMGGHGSSALWQLELMRLKKWKTSSKHFSPADVSRWIDPVMANAGKKALAVTWAQREDYLDSYPGFSVKVAKRDDI